MMKLSGKDINAVMHLFDEYTCNLPIIFSVFEGQYEGFAYVDDLSDLHWAVLCTPFLQHFVAGSPTEGCLPIIENILFDYILEEQEEKEIVIFALEKWNDILDEIFRKRKGVSDYRKLFQFSIDSYRKLSPSFLPDDIQISVEKCRITPFSLTDSWSAKLLKENRVVSHCDALMIGKGIVEIDISTDEAFRGKGFATAAAISLIDVLLENGLIPCWSTWPFRTESQHIAVKLGFTPLPDEKAWIWMNDMQE